MGTTWTAPTRSVFVSAESEESPGEPAELADRACLLLVQPC